MNELQIFKNEQFGEVRWATINNKDYAVAKDIATALGYKNTNDAIIRHCKGVVRNDGLKVNGIELILINENDILTLIQKSKTKTFDYKNKFRKWLVELKLINNSSVIESRKEIEFLDLLENILEPFNYSCIRQKEVLNKKYYIDLYIEDLKIAIEFDENNHKSYSYENQEERQSEIEKELQCTFIRVSDNESNVYNVGLIMKGIIEYGRFRNGY